MDVNDRIENNIFKEQIRREIVYQMTRLPLEGGSGQLSVFTLPGKYCKFENILAEYSRKNNINLSLHCAENDPDVFRETEKNLPPEGTVELGDSDKIISKSILRSQRKRYDAIWIDYCNAPTLFLIRKIARYASFLLKPNGVIYVSYCIHGRIKGGKNSLVSLIKKNHIDIRGNTDPKRLTNEQIKDIIIADIKKEARRHKINRFKKIYDVIYGGSGRENVTMITVGFSRGIKRTDPFYVPLIQENRLVAAREVRREISLEKGRKKKLTTREQVRRLLAKGWKDELIANYCGISASSVSSYKAHYNKDQKGLPWID